MMGWEELVHLTGAVSKLLCHQLEGLRQQQQQQQGGDEHELLQQPELLRSLLLAAGGLAAAAPGRDGALSGADARHLKAAMASFSLIRDALAPHNRQLFSACSGVSTEQIEHVAAECDRAKRAASARLEGLRREQAGLGAGVASTKRKRTLKQKAVC